jgi:hypothetical protein
MKEMMKEAYELPRIAVREIVLEAGIAEKTSVLTGSITQDAWGSSETTIGTGESDTQDLWIDLQ